MYWHQHYVCYGPPQKLDKIMIKSLQLRQAKKCR